MPNEDETRPVIRVERVALRGPGVLILTGPSSCGKGEVAAALRRVMGIDESRHLSMGEILRSTFQRARTDKAFSEHLAHRYQLTSTQRIADSIDTDEDLLAKVGRHLSEYQRYFGTQTDHVSQLGWLEFCTARGHLVPDRWTQSLIEARIEEVAAASDAPFVFDGYPRTVAAAEHLLDVLERRRIRVLKVLHLSISKQEMLHRAGLRGRADDHEDALRKRYEFYVESVQPSVDYLKTRLGSTTVALVDAHQPTFSGQGADRTIDVPRSINNVVASVLRALGATPAMVRDLLFHPPPPSDTPEDPASLGE